MNHTPEPWAVGVENAGGGLNIIARAARICHTAEVQTKDGTSILTAEAQANAAHIVACVNGCAGLDPAAYHDVFQALGSVIEFCHAALEGTCHDDNLRYYERMAYAALDRADGYKHGDRAQEIKDA